jgi:hypothetical protein
MEAQRVVAYGSMLGVAFGGFTWVVVAGHLAHDPAVTWGGYLMGFAVWLVGGTVLARYPARRIAVLGTVFLFVALVDWAALAAVLPRLPEQGGSIYVGTSRAAYVMLQPILIAVGLTGTGLVLWDLLRRR